MKGGASAPRPSGDVYEVLYSSEDSEVHRAVRAEAFVEDLGQTSWITAQEADALSAMMSPQPGERLLEVACGGGGVSVRLAQRWGLSVTGVDIEPAAVTAANRRAQAAGLGERADFVAADANKPLPFSTGSFDLIFCNDAINHLADRLAVLRDWRRLLKPGGRCLFTDPVVVTGFVSKEEFAARSAIGFFLFSTPEANRSAIEAAGFRVEREEDLTESVARCSGRWREARARRREQLIKIEGGEAFERLQEFLSVVHQLSSERRLSRRAYLGATVSDSLP